MWVITEGLDGAKINCQGAVKPFRMNERQREMVRSRYSMMELQFSNVRYAREERTRTFSFVKRGPLFVLPINTSVPSGHTNFTPRHITIYI